MTRFILFSLILIICLPTYSVASNVSVENYVPPPMFGGQSIVRLHDLPPLPPRRPDRINVPQSYIDYLRKHGRPPALIKPAPKPSAVLNRQDIKFENLIEPSAQDILDQINPQ